MGFSTSWVQTKHNQLVMLDTFFSAIQPQKSLCFIYAKRVPLVEDSRRVIIGVGWVEHVGNSAEYRYKEKGKIDSVLWERPVQHSMRPKFKDGFLLPYHEVLEHLNLHPEEDPSKFVAFAPDEHFWSFSYASEHVTNDGAIASLLSCNKALDNIRKVVEGPWDRVKMWIDHRLNELWSMRGPYPGLGAALHAFGVRHGNLMAHEIERLVADAKKDDPWGIVEKLIGKPADFPKDMSKFVTGTIGRKWKALPPERLTLLKLLSRFELTNEQAACYYVKEDKRRGDFRIDVNDSQLIENPYLLYEADRLTPDSVSLAVIDRGVFPSDTLREEFPLPEPSRVEDPLDERRVRAFTVRQLERAADLGHTLLPRKDVISQIRDLDVQPPCPLDSDMMVLAEEIFDPEIVKLSMSDESAAYQLKRLSDTGAIIRKAATNRLKGRRHQADINWRERLDELFDGPAPSEDAQEQAARDEKSAALAELHASRISVLIGPAGTGKTTLLKVLCDAPKVRAGGVHQQLEHLGHGRVAKCRPGPDHLGRQPGRSRPDGLPQQVTDVFVNAGHPVTDEQVLVLAGDRSLEAHHGVYPRCILRLDQKLRVGTVLASAVCNDIVYNDDLAVIAQVDPALQGPQQRIADRQGNRQTDARFPHGVPVFGVDHDARAQVVRHGPAGNAARRSPLQRLCHLETVVVRQPDVEQQVDVVLRRIDVGHHGGDGRIRILQQARPVTADGVEPVDRFSGLEQMYVALRHVGLQVRRVRFFRGGHIWQPRKDRAHPLHAASADVRFAQQDVRQDPQHRDGDNDHDPGDPRRRLPMGS